MESAADSQGSESRTASQGLESQAASRAEESQDASQGSESRTASRGEESQTSSSGSTESREAADPQKEAEEQLLEELGAFEITAHQRELAAENEAGYDVLDAGRGNPNWINTKARYAFARFMQFAIGECELTMNENDMAGQAKKEGMGARFEAAMDKEDEIDRFLLAAVDYCVEKLDVDRDDLLKEFVDGIIGDYYPDPSRCLPYSEKILNQYLQSTLYNGVDLADSTNVFATEGGTAAIVYLFESLSHNRILNPGDTIANATPIFTPYLQIPSVKDYNLVSVDVEAAAEDDWDIPEEELAKLEDANVKAFFLVNPSNPASHALPQKTIERLKAVVEKNPHLIILTDDVYGTFVKDFQTLYSTIPHNTILVYSFSKLYGVTGWRVGLIAINDDNVMDDVLADLPKEDKAYLEEEYKIVTTDVENFPFTERVVADSRSIGLYHTSGLSTPSQIFMDFMALTHLVYEDADPYIAEANHVVEERYRMLMETLELMDDDCEGNARYYALIDVLRLCEKHYNGAFASWLKENYSELTFLEDLALEEGVVLMYGPGFEAPYGTVRVSLANLGKEDYKELGRRLFELLDAYYEEFMEEGEAA